MKDSDNIVYVENKIMPWVQVRVLRVPKETCQVKYDDNIDCWKALYHHEYDHDDFDGS